MLAAASLAIGSGLACGGSASPPMWTETQAESITVVRGLEVAVRSCEGIGEGRSGGAERRFERFDCLAGARMAGQSIDTVAVTYVLRPLEPYSGPASPHELTRVSFGGLGVP
jgi:hypothetical protein